MEATPTRSRALVRFWSLLLVGLLLASLVLGVLAFTGRADPNLHGMVAVVTAGLAITSHMRRGSGRDFLAVLWLVTTVWLGFVVQGGGPAASLHPAVAVAAVVLSVGLHLGGWRGDLER